MGAETRTEEATDADDDLMSGFKSVSLNLDEDEAVADAKESGIQKLWDEIIPSELLEEMEEEEKQKELAELYLGPRQRKTVLGDKKAKVLEIVVRSQIHRIKTRIHLRKRNERKDR